MRTAMGPVLAATILGIAILTSPSTIDRAHGEYAGSLAGHDQLQPKETTKTPPDNVVVRKAFWNADRRILMVDVGRLWEKGGLPA